MNKEEQLKDLEERMIASVTNMATTNRKIIVDSCDGVAMNLSKRQAKCLKPLFDTIEDHSLLLCRLAIEQCRKRFE